MFAESPALGKELLCRVPEFAESQALGKASFAECWVWRSAKWLFAECSSFATRQTSTHSAKIQFPVVQVLLQGNQIGSPGVICANKAIGMVRQPCAETKRALTSSV